MCVEKTWKLVPKWGEKNLGDDLPNLLSNMNMVSND